MPTLEKNYILSSDAARMKLQRMAFEILENNTDDQHLVIAGIRENGYVVAGQIAKLITEISDKTVELISISIDKKNPSQVILESGIDLNNKVVILTDDVSNSGRTLTYALKPILLFFPRKIQTLVMVERSHKKFPVHPDYVGLSLSTFLHEHIFVEVDGEHIVGAYVE